MLLQLSLKRSLGRPIGREPCIYKLTLQQPFTSSIIFHIILYTSIIFYYLPYTLERTLHKPSGMFLKIDGNRLAQLTILFHEIVKYIHRFHRY